MPIEDTEQSKRIALAEQVIGWLEEDNGRRFDMTDYTQVDGRAVNYSEAARLPACRTACCIAGEIAIRVARGGRGTFHTAMHFLGLNVDEACNMFAPGHKPLSNITKREAIAMLRHWGETGVVKWL